LRNTRGEHVAPWDPDEINDMSRSDFESAWLETGKLIDHEGERYRGGGGRGSAQPIMESLVKIREVLLDLGFDETVTPLIWEDEHVTRQYGPESAVILDRCYYLAGLPRPEIGLSKEKLASIRDIVPSFSAVDELTDLLRNYKAGRVESDDFVEEMVDRLDIHEEQATEIIDKVFAEMKRLKPVPSRLTVLSHFTTAWFPILSELLTKRICPIKLFTTGVRMRREQREDATHLRCHYNASLVVMAQDFSLQDGRKIARDLLGRLGFGDLRFVTKKATSKYYAPGTEEEVFAVHPSLATEEGGIEVADLGMYSPVSLSRYGIPYPVFNMGFSIGRLAMIESGEEDIRKLTYPEIYRPAHFEDEEMEGGLGPASKPVTRQGKEISSRIVEVARENADSKAPCSYDVWSGSISGAEVQVRLVEVEKGHSLVGPAAFNVIYVRDGNIVSHPPEGANGKGGISYIACFADYAAAMIEGKAKDEAGSGKIRVGMVRSASDIHLAIPIAIRRYVESNNRTIDIRGPMFTTVEYEIG